MKSRMTSALGLFGNLFADLIKSLWFRPFGCWMKSRLPLEHQSIKDHLHIQCLLDLCIYRTRCWVSRCCFSPVTSPYRHFVVASGRIQMLGDSRMLCLQWRWSLITLECKVPACDPLLDAMAIKKHLDSLAFGLVGLRTNHKYIMI